MRLIEDSELLNILVKDNGEKLVYVKNGCPKIVFRIGSYIKKDGEKFSYKACFVREELVKRLNLAHSYLPKGFRIVLRCGFRPLSIQKKRYIWMYQKMKKQHSDWNIEKLKDETSKWVADPKLVPPHSTGGAIDISIIDDKGRMLDMGTKMGEFNDKTAMDSKKISLRAKNNRKLLSKIMTKAGFVNYPTEWWHWSYGDKYWAAVKKKEYSIYGSK